MRLNKSSLFFIYFACQFNPLIFYLVASSQGYGITGYRFVFSVCLSVIFFCFSQLRGFKLRLGDYLYIFILLTAIVGRAFLDITLGIRFDLAIYIIYIEYVFVYLVVAALYGSDLYQYFVSYKKLIIIFMSLNFFIWGWSLINGVSWGIFRAYISGITINRLPDFINPIIVPWIYATSGVLIAFAATIYVICTSYRSLYLSLIFSLILLLLFGKKQIRQNIWKNLFFTCVLSVVALAVYADGAILLERLLSLFSVESKVAGEASKSQRVEDFFTLMNSLPNCMLIGCGGIEPTTNISYYNFPYYPLWTALIFGPSSLLINLWVFLPIFLNRRKLDHNFLLAIWGGLLIILLVFPYVHYFCLVLFISLLQVPILRNKL
jgi:hypothetical protein